MKFAKTKDAVGGRCDVENTAHWTTTRSLRDSHFLTTVFNNSIGTTDRCVMAQQMLQTIHERNIINIVLKGLTSMWRDTNTSMHVLIAETDDDWGCPPSVLLIFVSACNTCSTFFGVPMGTYSFTPLTSTLLWMSRTFLLVRFPWTALPNFVGACAGVCLEVYKSVSSRCRAALVVTSRRTEMKRHVSSWTFESFIFSISHHQRCSPARLMLLVLPAVVLRPHHHDGCMHFQCTHALIVQTAHQDTNTRILYIIMTTPPSPSLPTPLTLPHPTAKDVVVL